MKKVLILLACLLLVTSCGTDDKDEEQVVLDVDPNNVLRVAGYAMDGELPVALWVDFDQTNDKVAKVTLSGYGNPDVMDTYNDELSAYHDDTNKFIGKDAKELSGLNADALESAVAVAADSYLSTKDQFVIRPYQSVMTGRYIANNPYIINNESLKDEVKVNVEVVAAYPNDAVMLVNEDVMSGDKVKFPAGNNVGTFKNSNEEDYSIVTPVAIANKAGVVVLAYEYDGKTLYSALDIYDNFTTTLSGSDAYGKVIATLEENDDFVTYRSLGDKAMNFPGGTCGSTVVDVTIDKTNDTIKNVQVYEASDSTYLSNPWEYGGGFKATGDFIKAIDDLSAKFVGLSAKDAVMPYVLNDADHPDGGSVVEGGVDMVVTGATRTANAIVYAVNAAIETYNK